MGMKSEIALFGGSLVTLIGALLIVVFAAGVGFLGIFPPFVITSTRHAPGYSEKAFEGIKVGDSEAVVLKALGEPLWGRRYDSGPAVWCYGDAGWSLWCHRRLIIFSNNLVAVKVSGLYQD